MSNRVRKSREEMRNGFAENVCREVRFQFAKYGQIADADTLFAHLEKWMRYAKKNKYDRP